MANIEQQQDNHLPGDSFPHSAPRDNHHAEIFPAHNNGQLDRHWEGTPPTVANGAVHGALQGPHQIDRANYGVKFYNDNPPPGAGNHINHTNFHAAPFMYHNVGLVQGVPDHEQVIAPETQYNGPFCHPPQGVMPGLIQAGFADPSSQQAHPSGQPTAENLRRVASRYLHHPGSWVDMVRMGPGSAGRYQVVIVLEMADLL